MVDLDELVRILRDMDHQQQETDAWGGREIAWYYYRPSIEAALELEPGALDTPVPDPPS